MRIAIALLAFLISLHGQVPQPGDFDGWKNRGIAAIRGARYQEAADAFEIASNLKPNDPGQPDGFGNAGARHYLGLTYMMMSITAQPPANVANASRARTEFQRVLASDPANAMAMAALAALSYQEAKSLQGAEQLSKLHEARDWNRRVISVDRTNKQAYLSLGVIAWNEFFPVRREARAADGLAPGLQDQGPLRNAATRARLWSQYGAMLDDAIANLREAIKIDPQYDSALDYASVLIRARAELRDTSDQYSREIAEATALFDRTVAVWRERSQHPPPPASGSNAWFEALAFVLGPPPPPPPPPPPLPGLRPPELTQATSAGADIPPGAIRVGEKVQQANLIHRVEPVCPALARQAKVSGVTKFSVIVDKTGGVREIHVISGHPMLMPAAQAALKEWQYKPTLLNGQPVEVLTQVEIDMPCGK